MRALAASTVTVGVCALVALTPTATAGAAGATVPLTLGAPRLVFSGNFPDPSLLVAGDSFYAYSTNAAGSNIQVMVSTTLVHWRPLGDAMAFLPTWAQQEPGSTWAPSVATGPHGGYEMFFSTSDGATGTECIGRATAPSPAGPFIDLSSAPFLCGAGGDIDPDLYRAGSARYLVWKADGENGGPQAIFAQRLGPDDASVVGSPVQLLAPDQYWEDGIVEGPDLVESGGHLWLFFSGNRWDTDQYAVGAASCASPLGPCQAVGGGPVLQSQGTMAGPGGPSFFAADGSLYLAFAAWTTGNVGGASGARSLYICAVGTTAQLTTVHLSAVAGDPGRPPRGAVTSLQHSGAHRARGPRGEHR